jgi:uncharacterized protein (DUF1697 family)
VTSQQKPSQRYIALLRAINVGKRMVKMDRLRAIFQELKVDDVETFIASGNVIFTAPPQDTRALEQRIEQHLLASLGFAVETFIRTPAELAAIAAYRPFGDEGDVHTVYVNFFYEPLDAEVAERVEALRTSVDDFHVHGREMYWLGRKKISDTLVKPSQMAKAVGKRPSTNRNLTTVRNLAEKYAED